MAHSEEEEEEEEGQEKGHFVKIDVERPYGGQRR